MNTNLPQPSNTMQRTSAGGMPQGAPRKKTPKQWLADYRWVLLIAVADLLLWLFWPAQAAPVMRNTWDYLAEMILILIPVAVLIGLLEVWVPKQLIGKYLGHGSGWKGMALSALFSTAAAGPLYVALPIAGMLLRKGASPLNVVIFLNTWAAIKIPQLLVETKFLGPAFMLARLALTVPSVILMGWLIQKFIEGTGGLDVAASGPEHVDAA
jgi:uncharacterized membrane protein YraQ (UPF0718 family)